MFEDKADCFMARYDSLLGSLNLSDNLISIYQLFGLVKQIRIRSSLITQLSSMRFYFVFILSNLLTSLKSICNNP